MSTLRFARRARNRSAWNPVVAAACAALGLPAASGADPARIAEDDDAPSVLADTTRATTAADLDDFDAPRSAPAPAHAPAVAARSPERPRERPKARPKGPVERREERRSAHERKRGGASVPIPGGCFQMGSRDGEGAANERPRHEVCLDSFRLDRYPASQREFQESMGAAPWTLCAGPACARPDPRSPAWFVTWSEADSFCRIRGGRLPTEAQYEYAMRAGDTGTFAWGDSPDSACRYANLADLSLARALRGWRTFPCDDGEPLVGRIGTRSPNRWGLHDMVGNVWEWTADWYAADAYAHAPRQDPKGPETGTGRVIRGGSWMTGPDGARAAYRDGFNPEGRYTGSIGFRCAYPAK